MTTAPLPDDESARLAALHALQVLDSEPEAEFDALVNAASLTCGVPISLISLIDANRQWFKANVGLPEARETSRDLAFCAHAILGQGVFEVCDAALDPRFADNLLVTQAPCIRFYAGAPICLSSGEVVGTLCVIDRKPGHLSQVQRDILLQLAMAAAHALEGRRAMLAQRESMALAERARMLLQHSADAVIGISIDGLVNAWNPAAERLLGYAEGDIVGLPVTQILPQGVADPWQQQCILSVEPKARTFNAQRRHRDGEMVAVSISLIPDFDADEKLLGMTEFLRDLRDQEREARELAVSEARFRALSDSSPYGVFYSDMTGACTYTNRRWQEIFGLSQAQSMGDAWRQRLHPDDKNLVGAQWERATSSGEEFSAEFRVNRFDGEVRHVLAKARKVASQHNEVMGYVGSVQDVTAARRTEQALRKSEAFLERTGRAAGVGGWELEIASGTLIWSAETCRIHGVEPGYEPSLDEAIEFYAPEARPIILSAVEKALQTGEGWDIELPMVRPDGAQLWVRAVGSVEFDKGQPIRLAGAFQDVSGSRKLAAELAQQHQLLRVTLNSIGDAVITTDAKGCMSWLNPVAEKLTGWSSAEAAGWAISDVFRVVNESSLEPIENPSARCLSEKSIVQLGNHALLYSKTGQAFAIEATISPMWDEQGKALGSVLAFRDVTEKRLVSDEMRYRATHDALTGLINRAEFDLRLARTLELAHEKNSQHALMYIDLDQFKLVNDACGHAAGDQLLKKVSGLLAETVRARDTLARLGGDEFAVLLEFCTADQAQRVALQICDKMDAFRFVQDDQRFRVGASIGLVPIDNRWEAASQILQAADAACYVAKEAGRNRVHTWFDSDEGTQNRHGEMQWATRIERALDEDRFVLFAQRIEDLKDKGTGIHAEVLLRMRDDDGSLIPPGAFLPAAERFHLASRIDKMVLRHVINWLVALEAPERMSLICVNLSGQSVADRAFHSYAMELLSEHRALLANKLCLEITETAAITNFADAVKFIEQVRALGVQVALDDFGSGASSFGYLKNLPVDILKIDGQFIRDIITDPLDDVAVRCFLEVAAVIGVKTVAEFVDKPEVLARLRKIGVDFAQGYLLHKPAPIDELLSDTLALNA